MTEIKLPIQNFIESITKINDHKIAAIIYSSNSQLPNENFIESITKINHHRQLQIYNKHNNKWEILIYDLGCIDDLYSFRFDQITKQFEIIHLQKNILVDANLFHQYNNVLRLDAKLSYGIGNEDRIWYHPLILKYIDPQKDVQTRCKHKRILVQPGSGVAGVFIDHENNVHMMFNKQQQHIWDVNNNNIKRYPFPHIFIDKNHVIVIPSKKIILMIGVNYYPVNDSRDERTEIWKYCFKRNEWRFISTLKLDIMAWILSPNEKYIIFIADNQIFILNLIDNKSELQIVLNKSQITLPKINDKFNEEFDDEEFDNEELDDEEWKDYYIHMTIMGGPMDETITDGWIKKLFRTSSFKHLNLPPKYLIKLISQFYDQPMLHILYTGDISKHYKIQLEQILQYSKEFHEMILT